MSHFLEEDLVEAQRDHRENRDERISSTILISISKPASMEGKRISLLKRKRCVKPVMVKEENENKPAVHVQGDEESRKRDKQLLV